MGQIRFDWRWIAAFLLVAILVAGQSIPWPIFMLALGLAGGYLIYIGWQAWQRAAPSGGGSRKVTYWRGQRIELDKPSRGGGDTSSLKAIAPSLLYFVLGGAMVLAAVAVLFQNV